MPTHPDLDDELIEEARRLGGHRTQKDAVTAALRESVQRRKQVRIIEMFGKVDDDPLYYSRRTSCQPEKMFSGVGGMHEIKEIGELRLRCNGLSERHRHTSIVPQTGIASPHN